MQLTEPLPKLSPDPARGLFLCYDTLINKTLMKELTVVAIKREDGLYHFDHPHNDTVEELLMNGTEEAIDDYYYFKTGNHAVEGDEVEISLFLEEPEEYDTLLVKEVSDEDGTTYTDTTLCIPVWLCNWLQGFFGEVPDEIYIKVRPINQGLETFVKRTGMKGLLNK